MLSKILHHPVTAIVGTFVGFIVGIFFKKSAVILGLLGQGYISLLMMAILPMVVALIITNLTRLTQSGLQKQKLLKFFIALIVGMVLVSAFASIMALVLGSSIHLKTEIEFALGNLVKSVEFYPANSHVIQQTGFGLFLKHAIPSNVFLSLTEGLTLKVIIVSVLIGAALSATREPSTKVMLKILDSVYLLFSRILQWLLFALPMGLLCIIAGIAPLLNLALFLSVIKIIFIIQAVAFIIIAICVVFLAVVTKKSLIAIVLAFRGAIPLTFIFASTFLTIPQTVSAMKEIGVDEKLAEILYPLGTVINRSGRIALFAILATIIMVFYHHHLSFHAFIMINLLAIILGATASGRGPGLTPYIVIMASTLGFPVSPAETLLILISPFIFQIIETLAVAINVVVVSTIGIRHDLRRINNV